MAYKFLRHFVDTPIKCTFDTVAYLSPMVAVCQLHRHEDGKHVRNWERTNLAESRSLPRKQEKH